MLCQCREIRADQMFPIMSTLFIHSQDTTARSNVSCLKIKQIPSGTNCFLLCFTALYLQVLILLSFLKSPTPDLLSGLLQHLAQCAIHLNGCYWLPLWRHHHTGTKTLFNWSKEMVCTEQRLWKIWQFSFFLKQWHKRPRLYCFSKTSWQWLFLVVTDAGRCALQDECTARSLYTKAKVMLWSTVVTTFFLVDHHLSLGHLWLAQSHCSKSSFPMISEWTGLGLLLPVRLQVYPLKQVFFNFPLEQAKSILYCVLFKAGKTMAAKVCPDDVCVLHRTSTSELWYIKYHWIYPWTLLVSPFHYLMFAKCLKYGWWNYSQI